jgi:DNA-directed RNA polymerase specialized sigma subunit
MKLSLRNPQRFEQEKANLPQPLRVQVEKGQRALADDGARGYMTQTERTYQELIDQHQKALNNAKTDADVAELIERTRNEWKALIDFITSDACALDVN